MEAALKNFKKGGRRGRRGRRGGMNIPGLGEIGGGSPGPFTAPGGVAGVAGPARQGGTGMTATPKVGGRRSRRRSGSRRRGGSRRRRGSRRR